jgi:hypothetical protein
MHSMTTMRAGKAPIAISFTTLLRDAEELLRMVI